MAISIRNFGGIAPKIPARYLADEQAQTAVNCPTWKGPLAPLLDTAFVTSLSKSGDLQSVYRFGLDVDSETQYWFHWTTDVDVVRGFINGDTSERTYYTGDGVPKVTDNTLALGAGTNYPLNFYQLGVPAPASPATCAIGGTPDANSSTETRVYTYTFVNSWGEESAPASASLSIDVETGETVTVSTATSVTGNYNVQSKPMWTVLPPPALEKNFLRPLGYSRQTTLLDWLGCPVGSSLGFRGSTSIFVSRIGCSPGRFNIRSRWGTRLSVWALLTRL